jgi:DNA-binding transcriptional ArsR family regulator
VPPLPATSDVFTAIADSHRRALLTYLAPAERSVSDMVAKLRLRQPAVSKHLRVLRDVGLVQVRREGRQKLYRTDADAIQPVYDWTKIFEPFWHNQLLRIKQRAEGAKGAASTSYWYESDEGETP